MKEASRAAFLVAAAVCAVVIGRAVNGSFRSGLPDAVVGVSHAHAAVPSTISEVAGIVTRVSDGDTIWVEDSKSIRHKIRLLDIDAPESTQKFGGESTARLKSLIGGKAMVEPLRFHDGKYGEMKFWWKVAKDERELVVRCYVSPKKQMAVCTLLHTKGDDIRAEYIDPNAKR